MYVYIVAVNRRHVPASDIHILSPNACGARIILLAMRVRRLNFKHRQLSIHRVWSKANRCVNCRLAFVEICISLTLSEGKRQEEKHSRYDDIINIFCDSTHTYRSASSKRYTVAWNFSTNSFFMDGLLSKRAKKYVWVSVCEIPTDNSYIRMKFRLQLTSLIDVYKYPNSYYKFF